MLLTLTTAQAIRAAKPSHARTMASAYNWPEELWSILVFVDKDSQVDRNILLNIY